MLEALIGRRSRLVHGVCPPGLDRLTAKIAGPQVRLAMLKSHTLVAYALSSTAVGIAGPVVKRLVAGDDKDLFKLLHLTALRSTFVSCYQYCEGCVNQEIASNRLPYWHRLLQLHGISHCPEHGTHLFRSSAPFLARTASELRVPSSATAPEPGGRRQRAQTLFSRELQGELVALAKQTLGSSRFGTSFGRKDAARMLRRLGYRAPHGQVRAGAVSADFTSFLRTHTHRTSELSTTPWWLGMFTAAASNVPPLARHVFMVFLRRQLEAYSVKPTDD